MCGTCGCDDTTAISKPPHSYVRVATQPDHATRIVRLQEAVLTRNDGIAAEIRSGLSARRSIAVNLVGSPGAGKTSLLVRTLRDWRSRDAAVVIEGDQATDNDAARIRATGRPAVQINTGGGCHLDASMVARALAELDPPEGACVFVENVGNLVCPALFDVGEGARIVVASVTEGDDKPEKYPTMFRSADLVVLNKVDLLAYVPFDVATFRAKLAAIRPSAEVLPLSAHTGAGMEPWYGYLDTLLPAETR